MEGWRGIKAMSFCLPGQLIPRSVWKCDESLFQSRDSKKRDRELEENKRQ